MILERFIIAEVLHAYSMLFFHCEKGFQDLCVQGAEML
jgi:hypothetical protein